MIKRGFIIIIIIFLFVPYSYAMSENKVKARILSIDPIGENSNNKLVTVEVIEGAYVNELIEINHMSLVQSNMDLKIGQRLLINININENNQLEAFILSIDRRKHLLQLCIIFILSTVLFGRLKGISSLISLCITGFVIIKILIPNIIIGYNPILISVACSILIIIASFIMIAGFTRKCFVAILGTSGGTIIAGILAYYYSNITSIMGIATEEAFFLTTEMGVSVDFRGLFMGGILIGTVGAIMDVSMSITSFIFELREQSPRISHGQLMISGLSIGKDVMATMINTLILAYAGASMPLFLVFFGSDIDMNFTLNTEVIAGEIIRALCGSIGLIFSIPLTIFVASIIAKQSNLTTTKIK